ncbi:MAG: lipopolysaccharide biosynthesis protein [Streptosporangiaceae bacterium]
MARQGAELAPMSDTTRRAGLRTVARGGSLNAAGAAVAALAGVGLTIVVTRAFDRREAGVFFAATSVFLLAKAVAKLGTQTGVVYFVARVRALGASARVGRLLSVALTPVVACGVLLGLALFILAPGIAGLVATDEPGRFAMYLRVLAVLLPVAAVSDVGLAATRGYGTMRPTALLDNIGRPLGQLLLVLAVAAFGGSTLLGLAWAGPYVVLAAIGWWWLGVIRRRRDAAAANEETDPGPSTRTARDFWRYTSPRALSSVAQLGLQRLDIILVAALAGAPAAAIYAAATRFLVVGQLGSRAIALAVQPRMSALLARDDRGAVRELYQTSTAWLVLALWPAYLLFALFAPYVLRIFGGGYEAGTPVVVVLALAMMVATGCGAVDMVLNMAGRTTWTLANVLVALAVNVGIDLLLIPRMGVLGAAVGWAVAIAVTNVVPVAQLGYALRLHPFGRGTLGAFALAGLCFGALPAATRLIAGNGLFPLLGATFCGTMLYGLGCWRWRRGLRLGTFRAVLPTRRGTLGGQRRGRVAA